MSGLIHRLAHRLGWTTGEVEVFWVDSPRRLMVGFRCHGCGQLRHVHESRTTRTSTPQVSEFDTPSQSS